MAAWSPLERGRRTIFGPQPNASGLCHWYPAMFKLSQVCAAHNLNVNTCAMFDLPLTFATAPHRA